MLAGRQPAGVRTPCVRVGTALDRELSVRPTLKYFHKSYYKGNKIVQADFAKMTVNNTIKILRETGMGAPRPDLEEDVLARYLRECPDMKGQAQVRSCRTADGAGLA